MSLERGDNLAIGTMPSDSIWLLKTKYTKDIGFTLKKNWHIYIIIFYKIVQTFIYLGKIGTPGYSKSHCYSLSISLKN